jgi:hypothetical protein
MSVAEAETYIHIKEPGGRYGSTEKFRLEYFSCDVTVEKSVGPLSMT